MRISRINPRNQGGLRHLFDISDPDSNPETIDMTSITPVVEMSFGGYSKLNDYTTLDHCQQIGDNIAGQNSLDRTLINYGNFDGGGDPQIAIPVGYNAIVWGIKTHVKFDAAGATAFNGKYITAVLKLYSPDGIDMDKVFWTTVVHITERTYQPWITRQSICIIPAGCKLELWWLSQDGTNFPANTTLDYKLVTQSFPIGSPLPIGI